jgi:hypothetical protein
VVGFVSSQLCRLPKGEHGGSQVNCGLKGSGDSCRWCLEGLVLESRDTAAATRVIWTLDRADIQMLSSLAS